MHDRRSIRPRLTRDATVQSPRLDRSPSSRLALNGLSRRSATRAAVPPVSTLLDSADRHSALPPPPPVPESRDYYNEDVVAEAMDAGLGSRFARLQETTRRLERETDAMRERLERTVTNRGGTQQGGSGRAARRRLPPPPRLPQSLHAPYAPPHGLPSSGRVTVPTPSLDSSSQEDNSLFVPEMPPHRSHPLRNSWSADSVDGLGDRNRWVVMPSTITPDPTLPSTDSTLASAAASQSFNSDFSTTPPQSGLSSSASQSRRGSSDETSASDSASSVDPNDLVCDDEYMRSAMDMSQFLYDYEMLSPEGQVRIRVAREHYEQEGNRYTNPTESAQSEIGFRLIGEALLTVEGQERFVRAMQLGEASREGIEQMREPASRYGQITHPSPRRADIYADDPPTPDPERYPERTVEAIREMTAQVRDLLWQYYTDAPQSRYAGQSSPPTRYTPHSQPTSAV